MKKLLCLLLIFPLVLACGCQREVVDPTFDTEPATLPYTESSEPELESTEPIAPETDPTETETAPSESETETPPATEDPLLTQAREIVDGMTLEDKIAQLFVVTPEALTGIIGYATVAGQATRSAFDKYPVGGVVYMGGNLRSTNQTKELCSDMQAISLARTGLPALICVDEEGGAVARISGTGRFGVDAFPKMREVGDSGDVEKAGEIGAQIGTCLAELGFNVDFAPVADVLTNEENTIVKERSFGTDAALVTKMCAAYAEGLQSAGVLATYKHFPGHGATAGDSHKGFAVSERTEAELLKTELQPFADAAKRGVPLVMVGHITLPQVTEDGLPASLSYELVTGLLREKLGYDGLVITDSLSMGAITQNYEAGEAAVLAVQAGCDLLLTSASLSRCIEAILDAVESGDISEERIDESVVRIVYAKLNIKTP